MGAGIVGQPLEVLLFSDLAVVIAYVHQLTIFMIVPIFNSMARIDKRVVEAAVDAGASRLDIMRYIIVPMSKSGIALGTIFVVSIVMGDFFLVKVMSGGGSARWSALCMKMSACCSIRLQPRVRFYLRSFWS